MKKIMFSLITVLEFVLFSSCGLTDDRESKAQVELQQKVMSESKGTLQLSNFKKTNGYEQNLGGMEFYNLEWQAHLNVQVDLWKNGGAFEGYWRSFSVMQKPPSKADMIWARFGPTMPKEFVKGATVILTGESQLQKADNGWRVVGSQVKSEQTLNNERSPSALAELQRQQELAVLEQQKAQAAEQQRLAAIADNEAREREEARKRHEALVTVARRDPTTIGQFECIENVHGGGERFGITEYRTYRLVVTTASVTREVIKVTAKGGLAWSKPDGKLDVIWFDELNAKPSYTRGARSTLDREITTNSDRLGNLDLYCSGDQDSRTPANDLENTFNILSTAIDEWKTKNPELARW